MKLLIASHNQGKVSEFKRLLSQFGFEFVTLNELKEVAEPIEDGLTLWENALIKAKYYFEQFQMPVVCDDTGLFIDALNGEPGINAARFSGLGEARNRAKVLKLLDGSKNRHAYFETALIFYDGHRLIASSGRVDGAITEEEKGQNGFGYDAIFMPNGYHVTMAELSSELKNQCSHRYYALKHLVFKLRFYLGLDHHFTYLEALTKNRYPDKCLLSITAFPGGMSNNTYLMEFADGKKVARFPGECAEIFVDRQIEYNCLKAVQGLKQFVQFEYFDNDLGVKISPYINNSKQPDLNDIVKTLESFHQLPMLTNNYEPFKRLFYYERLCLKMGIKLEQKYYQAKETLLKYQKMLETRALKSCHNDAQLSNWLFDDERAVLIDLEFTGNNDPYYDYACFGNDDLNLGKTLLSMSLGRKLSASDETVIELWYALQATSWYLVALFKETTGLNETLKLDFNAIALFFLNKASTLLANK